MLGQVQNYLGGNCPTFTWPAEAGQVYKALPSGAQRKKDLTSGGFVLNCDLRLMIVVSQFANGVPLLKQSLTYLGDRYRIDSITKLQGGNVLRLECNDASHGS